MFKVNASEYKELLKIHYETKSSLFVWGGVGVGKSTIPRQVAKEIASSKNRKYGEWMEMTEKQQNDAISNPMDWLILTDFRVGSCDSSDLRGLPKFGSEQNYVKYAPMSWVEFYRQPDADGFIFFDELNLAPPLVSGQCYQIINERVVSDVRLSNNVFIFGAGNRAVDKASVFNMAFPLKDRFSEIELTVDVDEWCEWALNNGINPHLVAFIKWKPDCLYDPPQKSEDKGSTPRGVARTSKLMQHVNTELSAPIIYNLVSSSVGEAFATLFLAYCTCCAELDFEAMIKNPDVVKSITSPDKRYAICGLLGNNINKVDIKDESRISKMFEIVDKLPVEFGMVAMNIMRHSLSNPAVFGRMIRFYPHNQKLLTQMSKLTL
jgi:hypothetical protein